MQIVASLGRCRIRLSQLLAIAVGCLAAGCSGGGGGGTAGAPVVNANAAMLSSLAGNPVGVGSVDGTGSAANFDSPRGLAVDSAGNVFVADQGNHTIRKITPEGVVTTFAGRAGFSGNTDGMGGAARFSSPCAIVIDASDTLYVAQGTGGSIRVITPAGVVSTRAGASGSCAIAVDGSGNLYTGFGYSISKISPAGTVTTLAGTYNVSGSADGSGASASFSFPMALAADATGNVYVSDLMNGTIRKVTPSGDVTTLAGTAGVLGQTDGTGAGASFSAVMGLALDANGDLLVIDSGQHPIRKVSSVGVVTTIAGSIDSSHLIKDGTGLAASFARPQGLAVAPSGIVYVSDWTTIRKMTPSLSVTTLVGVAPTTGFADGTGAAATFSYPGGIAVDADGNLLVAEGRIRRVSSTGLVTTLANTSGGPIGAVAIDASGNIYGADRLNNVIIKIARDETVTTLAGTAGTTGTADGTGPLAQFTMIEAMTIDGDGNLYVTDSNVIRKISASGIVTTIAGNADGACFFSVDGVGVAAGFCSPLGIAADRAGYLYVADTYNDTIRKISPTGVVTTLAGIAGQAGHADGEGNAALFNQPTGIAVDDGGNVYVADSGNSVIRKISPAGMVTTVVGVPGMSGFLPGALPGLISHPGAMAWFGGSLYFVSNTAIVQVTKVP